MKRVFSPITRHFPTETLFNDKRLEKRFHWLKNRMEAKSSSIINHLTMKHADRQASYRFMRNDSVKTREILGQEQSLCRQTCRGRELVVVGDTSQFNLKEQVSYLKDSDKLGVLGDNKTPGFLAHANMAMDAHTGAGLGLSDLMFWTRQRREGRSPKLPYEQRESYKWELGIKHSEEILAQAEAITYVFDRESDIFSLFAKVKAMPETRNLISRVHYPRKVQVGDSEYSLDSLFDSIDPCGCYTLPLRKKNRRNTSRRIDQSRQERAAKIQVRFTPIMLQAPLDQQATTPSVQLWAVEALESADTVPQGEEPVHWRLITTHEITSPQEAMKIIRWYEMRWMVEELFRLLKTQGFNIEGARLEYFSSILKLTAMAFSTALKTLQLVLARDNPQAQPLEEVFSESHQSCLAALNEKYQGETEKQRNPYPPDSLSWASWIIGRIGGWKGLKSQGWPGPITMKRGLDEFYTYYDAWTIFSRN